MPLAVDFSLGWKDSEFTSPKSYVSSDISISPELSVTPLICTGAGNIAAVNFNSNSLWNTASLSGVTTDGSTKVDGSDLYTAPAYQPNFPVRWVNQEQSDSLYSLPRSWLYNDANPGDVAKWTQFLKSKGIMDYASSYEKEAGLSYKQPGGGGGLFPGKYLAYVGLFCRSSANIQVSGGGPSFTDDFYGSPISHSFALPAGSYAVSASLNIPRCIAAVRNTGTYPSPFVITMVNDSFAVSASAAPKTITVENPFVCKILPVTGQTVSNPTPTAGSTITYSFSLQNTHADPARSIQITNVALSPSSIAEGFPASGFTYTAAPNPIGSTQSSTISGSVVVPNSAGVKHFNVSITYKPTTADCASNQPNCNMDETQVASITVAPNSLPNYVPEIAAPANAVVGVPFQATITTRNTGTAASAAASKTQINFTGIAPILADVPALAVGAGSPSVQSFTCANEGVTFINVSVDANSNIGESNELDNFASQQVICGNPILCSLSFADASGNPHSSTFTPNDWAWARANCSQGGVAVACPGFDWVKTATGTGTSISPAATGAALQPQTNLSTSSASFPQTGTVSASNATQGVSCPAMSFDVQENIGSLNITCSLVNHDTIFFPPDSSEVEANCSLGGVPHGCPSLSWSTTLAGASIPASTVANGPRVTNNLVVPSGVLPQNGKAVNIACANPLDCSAACNVSVGASNPPTNMSCRILDHASLFSPNDWAMVQANCSDSAGLPTACTRLKWYASNLSNISANPEITQRQPSPKSNFSTHDASTPQSGLLVASPINSAGDYSPPPKWAACAITINQIGPDYIISGINATTRNPNVGDTVAIDVVVKNQGQLGTNTLTLTQMNSTNCSAVDQQINTPGLLAGASSNTLRFTCLCSSFGIQTVFAMADAINSLAETNENNNAASATFFCRASSVYIPQCMDFV